jgi:hypothetical protein
MNIFTRESRILVPSVSKTLICGPHRSIHTYSNRNLKFPTTPQSHSFGVEGNLGIAPKTMSSIQNLTLNDGNKIPLVKQSSREQLEMANACYSLDMALEPLVQRTEGAGRA